MIIASGVETKYFNFDPKYLYPLKSLKEALKIRNDLLSLLEEAESNQKSININIIGAGPSGVEIAGALSELVNYSVAKEFKFLTKKHIKINLIDMAPHILSFLPKELSIKGEEELKNKGINLYLNQGVTDVSQSSIKTTDYEFSNDLSIWTAGVKTPEWLDCLNVPKVGGRIEVEEDNSLTDYPNIFAIGDICSIKDYPLAQLSPVAIGQGKTCAQNILNDLKDSPRKKFKYFNKGIMATIGRSFALVKIGPLKFTGFLAWILWLWVHIFFLIGFRNKLLVLIRWSLAYLSYKQGARVIVK